jgi:hypothetical protein
VDVVDVWVDAVDIAASVGRRRRSARAPPGAGVGSVDAPGAQTDGHLMAAM